MIGTVEFEIPSGDSPDQAASRLVHLARCLKKMVRGLYNGVPMVATPHSNAKDVADLFYWESYERMTREQRCQAGL